MQTSGEMRRENASCIDASSPSSLRTQGRIAAADSFAVRSQLLHLNKRAAYGSCARRDDP